MAFNSSGKTVIQDGGRHRQRPGWIRWTNNLVGGKISSDTSKHIRFVTHLPSKGKSSPVERSDFVLEVLKFVSALIRPNLIHVRSSTTQGPLTIRRVNIHVQ